eukprot:757992-Hanusia_phi.AAC.1
MLRLLRRLPERVRAMAVRAEGAAARGGRPAAGAAVSECDVQCRGRMEQQLRAGKRRSERAGREPRAGRAAASPPRVDADAREGRGDVGEAARGDAQREAESSHDPTRRPQPQGPSSPALRL